LKREVALVLPMALQNLIISEIALSACSLARQVQFIIITIFYGLTSGAAILTAQYLGEKDIRVIDKNLE
jgi:Na+-driven multidrug efflux pump